MATTKSTKVAAQVQEEIIPQTPQGIQFEDDDTMYLEWVTNYGMVVIGGGNKGVTFTDSETNPGMKTLSFTTFDPQDPNSTAKTGGFHLSATDAKAFSDHIMVKIAQKKAKGGNPNTMVFSFSSLPGDYIPTKDGGIGHKWFNGVNLQSFKCLTTLEGPKVAGTTGADADKQAHENWQVNSAAASMLLNIKKEGKTKVGETVLMRLQRELTNIQAAKS